MLYKISNYTILKIHLFKPATMRKILFSILMIVATQFFVSAQNVPTPKSHFGFAIGDNYQLATFTQTEAY